MKNSILAIDTSEIYTAKVTLEIDGVQHKKVSESKILKSQTVLPIIEELLAEYHLKLSDITSIQVATGPGSFTGLRVGTTIANALGYLLDIPVNGTKTLVTPTYS